MEQYAHVEAFCLMKYRTEDGSETEILWNSRDGVTPFMVNNRAGDKLMQHVEWQNDRRDPGHVPAIGDRVFVDVTDERIREVAKLKVERFWNDPKYPASKQFESKDAFFESLLKEMATDVINGSPDVLVVDQEFLDKLAAKRSPKGN